MKYEPLHQKMARKMSPGAILAMARMAIAEQQAAGQIGPEHGEGFEDHGRWATAIAWELNREIG